MPGIQPHPEVKFALEGQHHPRIPAAGPPHRQPHLALPALHRANTFAQVAGYVFPRTEDLDRHSTKTPRRAIRPIWREMALNGANRRASNYMPEVAEQTLLVSRPLTITRGSPEPCAILGDKPQGKTPGAQSVSQNGRASGACRQYPGQPLTSYES